MEIVRLYKKAKQLIEEIESSQEENINKVAKLFKQAVVNDDIIHIVGTGYSHMLAEELFVRTGGLPNVNAILDANFVLSNGERKSGKAEKLEGLADIIWEEHKINSDDIIIIVSNSGRNAVPIEIALLAKEKEIITIALNSLAHSKNSVSHHKSDKKLYELADLVLDNCVPKGDSIIEIGKFKTGAASTLAGVLILNSIQIKALQMLKKEDYDLTLYQSQNLDGVSNEDLFNKYSDLIKHL